MIYLFFLVLTSCTASKIGPYFAEPKLIYNQPNDYPDLVESYFYLQQTSKWTVQFKSEMHVKKRIGPMMGDFETLAWTGRRFKKPSGGPDDDVANNICGKPIILHFLKTLTPESGLDEETCSFAPGNYSNSLNYDEHLHEVLKVYPFEPVRIIMTARLNNKTLFGFTLQLDFHDLDLYNFIIKD